MQDRVKSALDNAKGNQALYSSFKHSKTGMTLEQLGGAFETDFQSWQGAYNLQDGTGDMGKRLSSFDTAREQLNLMTELLEEYANARSAEIQNEVKNSAIQSASIISGVILLLCVLSILIVRYLKTTSSILRISASALPKVSCPCKLMKENDTG